MMWIKKGLVYRVDNEFDWMKTHAQVPTPLKINENLVRIYFCSRDKQNRSHTTYIDVDAKNPNRILYEHNQPILPLGQVGSFDDSGVMPSCAIRHNQKVYLYYVGWNAGTAARYRVAHGLAFSEDGGCTFQKVSTGPILDRSRIDPISVSSQTVLVDRGVWKMWYMSYVKWEPVNEIFEPHYLIKYAESKDGITWSPFGQICLDFKTKQETGIARPTVIKDGNTYRMWYSYRNGINYRTNKDQSYRIGYAESSDGINWTRLDNRMNLDISDSGWDSEMIAYPAIYQHDDSLYMLYNGNGFGRSGFGYAVQLT